MQTVRCDPLRGRSPWSAKATIAASTRTVTILRSPALSDNLSPPSDPLDTPGLQKNGKTFGESTAAGTLE
jgi:hypothetical protein